MQVVCDGIRNYTRNVWGENVWQDFEFGSRVRKFIVYNDRQQVMVIGMCKGFNTEATYNVQTGGTIRIIPHTRLKAVMQTYVVQHVGWLEVAKDVVMRVSIAGVDRLKV